MYLCYKRIATIKTEKCVRERSEYGAHVSLHMLKHKASVNDTQIRIETPIIHQGWTGEYYGIYLIHPMQWLCRIRMFDKIVVDHYNCIHIYACSSFIQRFSLVKVLYRKFTWSSILLFFYFNDISTEQI